MSSDEIYRLMTACGPEEAEKEWLKENRWAYRTAFRMTQEKLGLSIHDTSLCVDDTIRIIGETSRAVSDIYQKHLKQEYLRARLREDMTDC